MAFFEPFILGELQVDPFNVWWRGEVVALRPIERLLLLHLIRDPGATLTIGQLGDVIDCEERPRSVYGNLRSYIARARKRFWAVDPHFDQIESVKGIGFRWATE